MSETIGVSLDEFENEEFMHSRGLGVLGLARNDTAYTLPIAFAYDGDNTRCVLRFVMDTDSRKREFLETTETASLTVYEFTSPGAWRSVVARGTLQELPTEEIASAAALFSDVGAEAALDIFNKPLTEYETAWFELRIEAMSGRGSP